MLGHQVELAEQIQTERKNLEELKTARDAQEAIVQTYEKMTPKLLLSII